MKYLKQLSCLLLAGGAAVAGPAWAQYGDGYYGHGMMWGGGAGFGWLFGPLMMFVFLGAVIVLIAVSIRWLSGSGGHATHQGPAEKRNTALDILKERYARGEIDREEFEEKKRHLSD